MSESPFDRFEASYDEALHRGLALSGENREFFARGRIEHLAACLGDLGEHPAQVLDFGCGDGDSAPLLLDVLKASAVRGVDLSRGSIATARRRFATQRTDFVALEDHDPGGDFDLVYCNGVLHHVVPGDRPDVLARIHHSLRPGGWLSLWDNNPWNPGTRWVMARIPFDRDAEPLSAAEARRLVTRAGFEVVRTSFLFVFPRMLRWLRSLERPLVSLPIGAQYQVLCRKS